MPYKVKLLLCIPLMEKPHQSGIYEQLFPLIFFRKAEAARSESQGAHAQGGEGLFSSPEGMK